MRKNADSLAILGDIAETGANRARRGSESRLIPAKKHHAFRRRIQAEDSPRQGRTAGAHQAGEPQDFPAMQLERDIAILFPQLETIHRENHFVTWIGQLWIQ